MSAIEALVAELSRLPTIGRKTALRLTYHLLKQPPAQAERLADALHALVTRVRACERCHNLSEDPVCAICRDPRRDDGLLCVVEEPLDIAAIERTGEYRGRYHVLGGRLAPLDGVGPERLTVSALVARVAAGGIREVIVATDPDVEGQATAAFVQQELAATGVRVSQLAQGLPVGGALEFADGVTIAQALAARRAM